METLVSSMQKSSRVQELKEKTSQLDAPSLSLDIGGSSVRMNVKMETFSLRQKRTQLRDPSYRW